MHCQTNLMILSPEKMPTIENHLQNFLVEIYNYPHNVDGRFSNETMELHLLKVDTRIVDGILKFN